mmetsp:Transcript_13716/g.39369  ORF Transcript_13716/g.39369 Transcript_13716/m.39369 type:complete len:200 (-) Transcript_13716:1994-2593(-)
MCTWWQKMASSSLSASRPTCRVAASSHPQSPSLPRSPPLLRRPKPPPKPPPTPPPKPPSGPRASMWSRSCERDQRCSASSDERAESGGADCSGAGSRATAWPSPLRNGDAIGPSQGRVGEGEGGCASGGDPLEPPAAAAPESKASAPTSRPGDAARPLSSHRGVEGGSGGGQRSGGGLAGWRAPLGAAGRVVAASLERR